MDGWLKLKPFISGKLSTHKVHKGDKGEKSKKPRFFFHLCLYPGIGTSEPNLSQPIKARQLKGLPFGSPI
jgi:hypothetical protein